MTQLMLMRWAGVTVAAAGAALMSFSGPLSSAVTGARLPSTSFLHIDWLLLTGLVSVAGGALMVQVAWGKKRT